MRQVHNHATNDVDYIPELYHLINRGVKESTIFDWLAINSIRVSNQMVQNTLRRAGREDLIKEFIQEEDVSIGDYIVSRLTNRRGKVIGINKNDINITVHWDAGGNQKIAKDSVFKIREGDIDSIDDLKKLRINYPDYKDIKKNVSK